VGYKYCPQMRKQLMFVVIGSAAALYLRAQTNARPSAAATATTRESDRTTAAPIANTALIADTAPLLHVANLASMRLVGDHYEADLPDGRIAELTLRPALQSIAEAQLRAAAAPRGAIVMMDVNGNIVAMAGQRLVPRGDEPEQFAVAASAQPDVSVVTDTWAPAASVFKIVSAAALLGAGVAPKDKVCFHGGVRSLVESNLRDSNKDDACADMTHGLAVSQNAIMGKLAFQHLTQKSLTASAHAFGFGTASSR
jgi:penicillin-binding protein A